MTKQDVEITIHETKLLFKNCEYPGPTREQIADKLKETIFSYTETRTDSTDDIPPFPYHDECIHELPENNTDLNWENLPYELVNSYFSGSNSDPTYTPSLDLGQSAYAQLGVDYITARINEQRNTPPKETYGKDTDPFNE